MGLVKSEDSKKWINAFLAVMAFILGFVIIRFMGQLGEWFDLEAKIPQFELVVQGLGIVTGLVGFIFVVKNPKASNHLSEVYGELVKVIWPDPDSVTKMTVAIVIGVVLLSGLFVGVDYLAQQLLELIY